MFTKWRIRYLTWRLEKLLRHMDLFSARNIVLELRERARIRDKLIHLCEKHHELIPWNALIAHWEPDIPMEPREPLKKIIKKKV